MCGIIGFIGKDTAAASLLVDSLKRMEYRGYDSAGIAFIENGKISTIKAEGKIGELERRVAGEEICSTAGIGHTRWATHGAPSELNAHPHCDCKGKIAVIHNGIVENYRHLKRELTSLGHEFKSDTDTEVLAHLFEHYYHGDIEAAVRTALTKVEGTYGIVVLCADEPDVIIGARNGSPLVIGVSRDMHFLASDVSALIRYTRDVVYLEDHEIVAVRKDGFSTTTVANELVTKDVERVAWDIDMIQKNGFPHFMLKEIFEQDRTVMDAVRGRLLSDVGDALLGGLMEQLETLRRAKRLVLIACGTSWHAALIGEYMIEDLARMAVEVEYASEFRYRNPVLDEKTVAFVISQSGETADTLAAMREARKKGVITLGIVNVVGSTIARENDGGVYIHAGPEIGVASTKAFTSQLMVLAAITLLLGRMRSISMTRGKEIVEAMTALPGKINEVLARDDQIERIAKAYARHDNFLYLGRGYNFPVALEGALKLKEISYVHAEGYPAAEMKHGPIALIDENMPVVVVAPQDSTYNKIITNIKEVKARGGRVIAIASEGDGAIAETADEVITIPQTMEFLTPILSVIPLQLLAYHIAVERGCHVDQPRNLAKSVTVE
jgi:glucosamine--fructose-6-phosphate aminotransferase (isomerizing)